MCPTNYHFISCGFFTPFSSQEFEWLHVSAGPQDSSEYSSWSLLSCDPHGVDSSADTQFIILWLASFSYQLTLMFFHRSLSDSNSHLVSRTLLSILVDLNSIVIWMVSIRPLISNSSSSIAEPLVVVPRTPITFDINVSLMFLSCL